MLTIDRIPLPSSVRGSLYATGFSAVGPDPDAALARVDGDTLVCLITEAEIHMRYPDYADWLRANEPDRALWLPTDDGDVTGDDEVHALVSDVMGRLRGGGSVVTHCGAGMARTAVVCILAMVGLGDDPTAAPTTFRANRPGGGPDGLAQASQITRLLPRLGVEPAT